MTSPSINASANKGATNTVKMMALATTLYLCTIMWGLQLNHAENIKTRGLSVHGDCIPNSLSGDEPTPQALHGPPVLREAAGKEAKGADVTLIANKLRDFGFGLF